MIKKEQKKQHLDSIEVSTMQLRQLIRVEEEEEKLKNREKDQRIETLENQVENERRHREETIKIMEEKEERIAALEKQVEDERRHAANKIQLMKEKFREKVEALKECQSLPIKSVSDALGLACEDKDRIDPDDFAKLLTTEERFTGIKIKEHWFCIICTEVVDRP